MLCYGRTRRCCVVVTPAYKFTNWNQIFLTKNMGTVHFIPSVDNGLAVVCLQSCKPHCTNAQNTHTHACTISHMQHERHVGARKPLDQQLPFSMKTKWASAAEVNDPGRLHTPQWELRLRRSFAQTSIRFTELFNTQSLCGNIYLNRVQMDTCERMTTQLIINWPTGVNATVAALR